MPTSLPAWMTHPAKSGFICCPQPALIGRLAEWANRVSRLLHRHYAMRFLLRQANASANCLSGISCGKAEHFSALRRILAIHWIAVIRLEFTFDVIRGKVQITNGTKLFLDLVINAQSYTQTWVEFLIKKAKLHNRIRVQLNPWQ